MTDKNDLKVIMCPPLSDYKEAPKDHSRSELIDCPKCKSKMWLSEKKKGWLMLASVLDKEILLGCYLCIIKMIVEDPSIILNSKRMHL